MKGVGDIIEPNLTIDFEMNMLIAVPKETINYRRFHFLIFDRHGNTPTILDIYNGIEIFNDLLECMLQQYEPKLIKVKDYLRINNQGRDSFCLEAVVQCFV